MLPKLWNGMGVDWSPPSIWKPMGEFHDRMNRLFGEMESVFNAPEAGAVPAMCPALNIRADADAVRCEAEVPGFTAQDIEIHVRGNELTIKGTRPQPEVPEGAVWHRRERGMGGFARIVTLPVEVDADKCSAEFRDGVLTISMPRCEASKPKRIGVRNADGKALT